MSQFSDDMGTAAKVLGFDNAHIAFDLVRSTPTKDLPLVLAMLTMPIHDDTPPVTP